jgi:hypothetical protein
MHFSKLFTSDRLLKCVCFRERCCDGSYSSLKTRLFLLLVIFALLLLCIFSILLIRGQWDWMTRLCRSFPPMIDEASDLNREATSISEIEME